MIPRSRTPTRRSATCPASATRRRPPSRPPRRTRRCPKCSVATPLCERETRVSLVFCQRLRTVLRTFQLGEGRDRSAVVLRKVLPRDELEYGVRVHGMYVDLKQETWDEKRGVISTIVQLSISPRFPRVRVQNVANFALLENVFLQCCRYRLRNSYWVRVRASACFIYKDVLKLNVLRRATF